MRIDPFTVDELAFAWCYRVYCRWQTHRRQPRSELANLHCELLSGLLEPYQLHLLELAADASGIRALISLEPTECVSSAVSKIKGRISKWLREREGETTKSKSLARGYFAATTGPSTSAAVEQYLERQGEHHGYANRVRPPIYVRQFTQDQKAKDILHTDHATTVIRFHVVMVTWRRLGVFGPPAAEAVSDKWRSLQVSERMFLDKVSFVPDHVHVAMTLHPSASPAAIIVSMMNAAQQLMWHDFSDSVIQARLLRLWQPSAYIGSFGDLGSKAMSRYIRRWEQGA